MKSIYPPVNARMQPQDSKISEYTFYKIVPHSGFLRIIEGAPLRQIINRLRADPTGSVRYLLVFGFEAAPRALQRLGEKQGEAVKRTAEDALR